MRNRLECNTSGDCVSIFCEPKSVDTSAFSDERLAASWIASCSDMECKNVRVIVISTSISEKRFNDPAPQKRTHGRQHYP